MTDETFEKRAHTLFGVLKDSRAKENVFKTIKRYVQNPLLEAWQEEDRWSRVVSTLEELLMAQ